MEDETAQAGEILPFRTGFAELTTFVEEVASGNRSGAGAGLPDRSVDGTSMLAHALGLVAEDRFTLTARGESFALAGAAQRPAMLWSAMAAFPPYAQAIRDASPASDVTEVGWFERWWSVHGYGSSRSNRGEAAVVLAKLVDAAGAGSFVAGRRGHPSRIEWSADAPARIRSWQALSAHSAHSATLVGNEREAPDRSLPAPYERTSVVHITMERDGSVHLRLPSGLSRVQVRRIAEFVELLERVEEK